MEHPLSRRIATVLNLDPAARAIEYRDQWSSWGDVGALSRAIADAVGPGAEVGIMLRNTPSHVAALLGVLLAGARSSSSTRLAVTNAPGPTSPH